MIGGYETAGRYSEAHQNIYSSVAKLINSKPTEVAIVESATRAWDLALSSIPFKKGDIVLVTHFEYISNYMALLQLKERIGIEVKTIPNDEHGEFSLPHLKQELNERVKLVCLSHVASTNGMIADLDGVGKLIKAVGAYYLLDGCQSIGQVPIDVEKLQCDFLCATGRKFLRGPRGSGFLYVRESALKECEPLFLDFSSASLNKDSKSLTPNSTAKRFENFEMSYAARIGLGVAVDSILEYGMETLSEKILENARSLRTELAKIPEVTLRDTGRLQGGIVTFSIQNTEPNIFATYMRERKINLSTTPDTFALDLRARKVPGIIRASLHYYNSPEEIQKFLLELKQFLKH